MNGREFIGLVLFLLIIVTFLVVGLFQKCEADKKAESLESNSVKTTGTVTRVKFTGSASGNINAYYTFDVADKSYEGLQEFSDYCKFYYKCAKLPGYRNETVGTLYCDVYYDSTDPENNKIVLLEKYCDIKK